MMIESYHNSPRRNDFGMSQLVALIMVALGSCLLAYALQSVPAGTASLGEAISQSLPVGIAAPALWVVEVALFIAIAVIISRNNIVTLITGVVLGIIMRFGLIGLFALILSSAMKVSFTAAFGQMQSELWAFRLLAILSSAALLIVAFRAPLAAMSEQAAEQPQDEPKRFAFAPKTPQSQLEHPVTVRESKQTKTHAVLTPPEGFTPVVPRENVPGMITIPVSIIFESIPEAQEILDEDTEVGVRLALLVPQLPNATVWLTWQQLEIRRDENGNETQETVNLRDRWVRVPPRYYATQVPAEFFTRQQRPTPWMSYPEVPQENFNLDGR